MTSRAQVAGHALAENGYLNGVGYPGPLNRYETYLGRGSEYSCGDFVTWVFATCGLRLPSMQWGCATGYAFCPSAVDYGRAHGIVIPSWQAQSADIFLFDWNGDGVADHTEVCTSNSGGEAYTIGGDSGPSNVDGYTGQGGVHRHHWSAPVGVGNHYVLAVLNASRLVNFAPPIWPVLMLKSPLMGSAGFPQYDTKAVQTHLNAQKLVPALIVDGVYGQHSHDAVLAFQKHHWPATTAMWTGTVTSTVRQALGLPTGP